MVSPRSSQSSERRDPALIWLAMVLVAGGVAPQLDTTVVNVGLNSVAHGLAVPLSTVQWVATAYLLAAGVTIPLSGWAQHRWGGKRVWLSALGLFLAGSVAAGLAPNAAALTAFRMLQGAATGILLPLLLTLLLQAAGDRPLGRLMTVVTIVAVVVPIAGPVIGGVIVQELNWRWLFLVNVPITILAIIAAWWRLHDPEVPGPQPLDVVGLLLLSPALATILYGLSAADGSVSSHIGFAQVAVLAPLVCGLSLCAAFVVHALHRGEAAILDLRIFRHRGFTGGTVLLGVSGLSLYGGLLLLSLYEQIVVGHDPLVAGLLLAPQGLGALLVRPVGPIVDRVGGRPLAVAGMLLALVGTAPYALAGASPNQVVLGAALLPRGAGLSLVNIAILATALRGLRERERAPASMATRIVQYVGGAFGTGVLATILAQQLEAQPAGLAGAAHAFSVTFWWSIAFTALGLLPVLMLPRTSSSNECAPV